MSKLRDVVVVRVSEKGDREGEHFHSPEVQIEAARRWAKDRGERLVASPIPEIDVSGRLPLSKRPGLFGGDRDDRGRRGRPARGGVFRSAGALAQGPVGGDRAGGGRAGRSSRSTAAGLRAG